MVTYLTPPVPTARLLAFCRRVRPGGFRSVLGPETLRALPGRVFSGRSVVDFALGLALMFGVSLSIGYGLLGRTTLAAACLGLAAVGGWWVHKWYIREAREMARQRGG